MLKWIFFSLAFLLCIFIIFATYLYIYRAPFISNMLTKIVGTQVMIKEIDISKQGLKAHDVRVANLSGALFKNAFRVKTIDVQITPAQLVQAIIGSTHPVTIEKIEITHPAISVELFNAIGSDNNWKRIIDRFPPTLQEETGIRRYIVKEIELTDIALAVKNRSLGNLTIEVPPIPYLIITPCPHDEPRTAEEITRTVFINIAIELGKQLHMQKFAELPPYHKSA